MSPAKTFAKLAYSDMLCFSRAIVVSSTSRVVGIEAKYIAREASVPTRRARGLFQVGQRTVGVEPFEERRQRHARRNRPVADRARPYDRRQFAIDRLAHLDAGAVDARMRIRFGARRAVAEVNHRVHATGARAAVRTREMYRQPMMKRDRAARNLDVDRRNRGDLRLLEDLDLLVGGEDVDEFLHADQMRARYIRHASVLAGRAVEGDPGAERVDFIHRPVGLILMRLGVASARVLVKRLIVP